MTYPKYRIEVEQGIIEINSVAPLHLSEKALLFEADTRQKYPSLLAYSTGEAIVSADKRTLRVKDPEAPASIIRIILDDSTSHWHTMVEAGRYSVSIGMFKFQSKIPDAPIYLKEDR